MKQPVEPVGESPLAPRVVAIPKTPEPSVKAKPPERIGDILRRARLERNDDVYQIAEYLCIKPGFLVALENSRYEEFPADAYVIGFLRTYANFLGVDGKEAVDRYRYEMAGRRKKPILSMPIPVSEGRAPSGVIMVGATIAVLLIYALWYGISSSNRAEVKAPSALPTVAAPVSSNADTTVAAGLTAPVAATNASATVPPAAPGIMVTGAQPTAPAPKADEMVKDVPPPVAPAKPDTAAAKDDKNGQQIYGDSNTASRIIIRATQSSWVMITDASGKAIFDHVLKTGDVYKVPNKPGLSLTTGNGNGIVLLLDGAELPKVASGAPHVVRNIPLDPDHLTSDLSSTDH